MSLERSLYQSLTPVGMWAPYESIAKFQVKSTNTLTCWALFNSLSLRRLALSKTRRFPSHSHEFKFVPISTPKICQDHSTRVAVSERKPGRVCVFLWETYRFYTSVFQCKLQFNGITPLASRCANDTMLLYRVVRLLHACTCDAFLPIAMYMSTMVHQSSFFSPCPLEKAIGSFFSPSGTGFLVTSTQLAATASLTSSSILAQAIPHTLMLTLPTGARGNESIHST